jgi:hypothetical protein
MSESLNSLETQRAKILQQFLSLGDLRPGSICAVVGLGTMTVGFTTAMHDPGHAPQIRVLRKVHGKSVAETLASPAAFHKAQREVSEFHRFQKLGAELVTISEKICRLRPLEQESGGWTAEEKKRLLRSIRKSRGK